MVRDTSVSGRMTGFAIHLFLLVVLAVTLFPFIHILVVSLSSDHYAATGSVTFLPRGFNTRAFEMCVKSAMLTRSLLNSILYTSLGTAVNMVMTVTMAYALAKRRLLFRGFFQTVVIVTFFFNGGLIPTFLLVRGLGMYNTIWALVIPMAISPWYLIILRTFLQTLPKELEESVFMDGGNDITVFFRIALPLSSAALASIALFYAVAHWNSWFPAVIYLSDWKRYPMQVVLRQIVLFAETVDALLERGEIAEAGRAFREVQEDEQAHVTVERLQYAVLFITIVPMLVVYPFIQRYFTRGLMIGSLKS